MQGFVQRCATEIQLCFVRFAKNLVFHRILIDGGSDQAFCKDFTWSKKPFLKHSSQSVQPFGREKIKKGGLNALLISPPSPPFSTQYGLRRTDWCLCETLSQSTHNRSNVCSKPIHHTAWTVEEVNLSDILWAPFVSAESCFLTCDS